MMSHWRTSTTIEGISSVDENCQYQNLSFTHKLFDMLSDERNREIIAWNKDGDNFEVIDPKALEREILPKYFRHSRFQSLVRQLNFYSFKKVGKERSSWIYSHEYFRRGQPELLSSLKRKTNLGGMMPKANNIHNPRNYAKSLPAAWRFLESQSTCSPTDDSNSSHQHRDSFDSIESKSVQSENSSTSQKEQEDEIEADDEEESIEQSEGTPSLIRSPAPALFLSTPKMIWHPLCSLQIDAFSANNPLFSRSHRCMDGYNSPTQQLSSSDDADSPKSTSSYDEPSTDVEEIEMRNQLFTSKASTALLNVLEQRSLQLDQVNSLMSFFTQIRSESLFSDETVASKIFRFLAQQPLISYEVALYMQALNSSLETLPYFRSMQGKQEDEKENKQFYNRMEFIFGGELNPTQIEDIVSHFMRFSMNLLQDIEEQLIIAHSQSRKGENSTFQVDSFCADVKESLNYLSNQYSAAFSI